MSLVTQVPQFPADQGLDAGRGGRQQLIFLHVNYLVFQSAFYLTTLLGQGRYHQLPHFGVLLVKKVGRLGGGEELSG